MSHSHSLSEAIFQNGSYTKAAAVTPDDNADLPGGIADAIWVGTGGNVKMVLEGDDSQITVLAGTGKLLKLHVKRVLSTGTAGSNIVALYAGKG